MILVLNLRPLLNGSSIKWWFSVILFVSISCSALMNPEKKGTTPSKTTPKDTTRRSIKSVLKDLLKKETDTLHQKDTVWVDKKYKIALILPLHLDSLKLDKEDKEIYPSSLLGLEFYEGVRMALDTLEKQGLRVDLNVFDYHKSSDRLKRILEKPAMKEMDYIVGPFFPFYLDYVTAFGKKHNIPVISPLSPDTSVTHNNRYFTMLTPSVRVHTRKTATYINHNYPHANFLLIHSDSSKLSAEEKSYNKYFKRYFKKSKDTAKTVLSLEEYAHSQPTDSMMAPLFLPKDTNIVFLSSLDQSYVYYLFSQLNRLQQDSNYTIKVFGPPRWKNFTSIDIKYCRNLDVHFTSSYWLMPHTSPTKAFDQDYRDKYYTEPSRFVYQGYDIFAFIGKICLNYGSYYEYGFKNLKKDGLSMRFKVTPVVNQDSIERYENQKVYFLHFDRSGVKPFKH